MNALKLEDLNLNKKTASAIETELRDFLQYELMFSGDRIEPLECRSRPGFIPHSHNKGGVEATSFMDQMNADQWIAGFKNATATLAKYRKYDIESFAKEKGITDDYADWTDEQHDAFYEYCSDDDQSTVMFSADLMLTSENEVNIRLCVCVKDAPYHRQYDDLMEYNIKFKSAADLHAKLAKLAKKKDVARFARAVRESY